MDGCLGGQSGDVVAYKDAFSLADSNCRNSTSDQFINGMLCSNTKSWIHIQIYDQIFYRNQFDVYNAKNGRNRTTSFVGPFSYDNRFALEANQEYQILLPSVPTRIYYFIYLYEMKPGDYIILKIPHSWKPYLVQLSNWFIYPEHSSPINSSSPNFAWYWNNSTFTISIMIRNVQASNQDFHSSIFYEPCYSSYPGCPGYTVPTTLPPISPTTKPVGNATAIPTTITTTLAPLVYAECPTRVYSRPGNNSFELWSAPSTWSGRGQPVADDIVVIPAGRYIVVDTVLPKLKRLEIEGVLEFDDGMNHRLEVGQIVINCGQLVAGWETKPMLKNVEIVLTGDGSTSMPTGTEYVLAAVGVKGMGVFGQLDLHGRPRSVTWTRLNRSVEAGDRIIELAESVDWQIGEEIVISTTSFSMEETEIRQLQNLNFEP